MINNTIQDKLTFIAVAGTRDVTNENKMVNNKRSKFSTPTIVNNIVVNKGLGSKNSIQLRLF
ncbi:MAG: hypothetical protein WBM77_10405 [Maribacter sp.]|jgi:hypothetical protein